MVSTQIVVDDDLMEYELAPASSRPTVIYHGRTRKVLEPVPGMFEFIRDDPRPSSGIFCLSTPSAALAQPVDAIANEYLCVQLMSTQNKPLIPIMFLPYTAN